MTCTMCTKVFCTIILREGENEFSGLDEEDSRSDTSRENQIGTKNKASDEAGLMERSECDQSPE